MPGHSCESRSRCRRHVLRSVDPVATFLEADTKSRLRTFGVFPEVIRVLIEDEVGTEASYSSSGLPGGRLTAFDVFPEALLDGLGRVPDIKGNR